MLAASSLSVFSNSSLRFHSSHKKNVFWKKKQTCCNKGGSWLSFLDATDFKLIAPFLCQLKKNVLVQIEPEMTEHWKVQQAKEKKTIRAHFIQGIL